MSASALVNVMNAPLTDPPIVNSAPGMRPPTPMMFKHRAALRLELRPRRANQANGREELQRKAVAPVLVAQVLKVPAPGCAGVVDDDVDGAVGIERRPREGRWRIRSSANPSGPLVASPPALMISRAADVQRRSIARRDDHLSAVVGQAPRDRAADAAAAAR